jgi:hypothetical protein
MSTERKYSAKTTNQYNSCISTIQRLYLTAVKQEFIFPDSLKETDKILDLLHGSYKKQSVMNFISAILWKLKETPSALSQELLALYHGHAKEMKRAIEHEKSTSEFQLTEKEKKSFMVWEDIQTIYQKIAQSCDRHNYNSFLDFVVVSLYVLHPPVRADYEYMRVFADNSCITEDVKENYCVLQTDPRFVFQQYKTSKYKGTTVVPIDPELHNILLDWMEVNTSDYLLSSYIVSKQEYKPFTDTTLCKRITSIFMKYSMTPVTINTLRHSFISFMSRHDQDSVQKRENAVKMMHSVGMAENYRRMVYDL